VLQLGSKIRACSSRVITAKQQQSVHHLNSDLLLVRRQH
jgi:hypothetical protein